MVLLRVFGALLLAGTLAGTSAYGQEKQLKKSELPAAVQRAADEQSKGATVRGYSIETENGVKEYEAEMLFNGHSKDVTFDSQGHILEIEEQVAFPTLPAEVREGIQKQAGKGRIGKVESLTKSGKLVAYEAKVITAGKRTEVQVGPDGKPLAHPE